MTIHPNSKELFSEEVVFKLRNEGQVGASEVQGRWSISCS